MFFRRPKPQDPSFYIYYGLGTAEALERLRGESLVIIEVRQWKPEDLVSLRRGGTRIYGYLSIMESPTWNEKRILQLSEADYWHMDDQRVRFDDWDSYLMDLTSTSYRSILLDEWGWMLSEWPLDGIFVDTVGDIEEHIPLTEQPVFTHAYRSLLTVVSSRHPGIPILQNRGFAQLEACSSLLDGFLWEDWSGDLLRNPWARHWIAKLRDLRRTRNMTVYAASSSLSPVHGEAARKLGFRYRFLPSGYDTLPDV